MRTSPCDKLGFWQMGASAAENRGLHVSDIFLIPKWPMWVSVLLITLERTLHIYIFALQEKRVYHKANQARLFICKNLFQVLGNVNV